MVGTTQNVGLGGVDDFEFRINQIWDPIPIGNMMFWPNLATAENQISYN